MVEEEVHEDAADRDVEPDGQRHPRQPPVTVEAAAPGAVDSRQRQRHHERRQHDVRDEQPEVDGAQPRRTVEGDAPNIAGQPSEEARGSGKSSSSRRKSPSTSAWLSPLRSP